MCVNPSTAKCGYNSSTGKTTLILVLNTVLTGPSFPFAVAPGDCLDVDAHAVTVSARARELNTNISMLLCLSRPSFRSFGESAKCLGLLRCGHDRDRPLAVEGGLFSGQ